MERELFFSMIHNGIVSLFLWGFEDAINTNMQVMYNNRITIFSANA
jgi:hypothetical protein